MIKIVKGNLLDATEDIIAHQVNLFGVMGAGVAYQIAQKYPYVMEKYSEHCFYFDASKKHEVLGRVLYINEKDKIIANMFCQNEIDDINGCLTNYEAMEKCLKNLNTNCKSVAIPYGIGCGIARGSWDIVYKIIQDACIDIDVTIYRL